VLEAHSAGSPTDPRVRWTDLKPLQLARDLVVLGVTVSRHTAAKLLAQTGFRRRSLRKELITGHVDPQERDQQFRHIAELRRRARQRGTPVLCIDTKKKELLGPLHRRGPCYSTGPQRVHDHDYRYLTSGVLVPHGVYDVVANHGFITQGPRTTPAPSPATPCSWPGRCCSAFAIPRPRKSWCSAMAAAATPRAPCVSKRT